jgi:RNA recognition motif-containing protein
VNRKLYVGNLPFATTEEHLQVLFSAVGTVEEVILIRESGTGRSRGFGFVRMSTEAEAEAAIARFHESDDLGRRLVVNVARPKEDAPRREGAGTGRDHRNGRREARW